MPNAMRPIPPGEILEQELKELNQSPTALARALKVPANRITGILHATRAVTADTALRLARYFGTTPEFWLNLQQAYDLRRTRRESGRVIERQVRPRAA